MHYIIQRQQLWVPYHRFANTFNLIDELLFKQALICILWCIWVAKIHSNIQPKWSVCDAGTTFIWLRMWNIFINTILIQETLDNYIAGFILVPTEIYNAIHTGFNGTIRATVVKHLSSVLWNVSFKKINLKAAITASNLYKLIHSGTYNLDYRFHIVTWGNTMFCKHNCTFRVIFPLLQTSFLHVAQNWEKSPNTFALLLFKKSFFSNIQPENTWFDFLWPNTNLFFQSAMTCDFTSSCHQRKSTSNLYHWYSG